MLKRTLMVAIASFASSILTCPICLENALAAQPPEPDREGYFRNIDWPFWRVVDEDTNGLNCRRGAGTNNAIVTRFRLMTVLVPVRPRQVKFDRDGDPWMEVRLANGSSCLVSANAWYVLPSWEGN
ncbi:MAG: hypothetical protein F6J93_09435 [Oscillatoria sp. SIO1A7]|nr:hypothetical protein [Oscillatoria sp. SIO1A7]